jgi:uncharacterized repeat protein (TIGR04052 family)
MSGVFSSFFSRARQVALASCFSVVGAVGVVGLGGTVALAQAPQAVTLKFDARVGDAPFECDRIYQHRGANFSAADFRFYVHDVALIDEAGRAIPVALKQDGRWQQRNLALLDFEDKRGACGNGTSEMRKVIEGEITETPNQRISGVRFTLGVPFALNHQDATIASAPLNLTSLFWNWRGGYKFARIDLMSTRADGSRVPFPIHLGSTGCMPASSGNAGSATAGAAAAPTRVAGTAGAAGTAGSTGNAAMPAHGAGPDMRTPPTSCANPNRVVVELSGFDVARDSIQVDLAALISEVDISVNQSDTPGCMSAPSDLDCVGIMKNFGVARAGQAAPQRFFRIAAR